jgi:hypothetical protein
MCACMKLTISLAMFILGRSDKGFTSQLRLDTTALSIENVSGKFRGLATTISRAQFYADKPIGMKGTFWNH